MEPKHACTHGVCLNSACPSSCCERDAPLVSKLRPTALARWSLAAAGRASSAVAGRVPASPPSPSSSAAGHSVQRQAGR